MSDDTNANIHCILEPTEEEARRACGIWITRLSDAVPREAYPEIPACVGIVHSNGAAVSGVAPVMMIGPDGPGNPGGNMQMLIGGALTITMMKHDPEEQIEDPKYAYFLCADGYTADKEKPRKWYQRKPKRTLSLEESFNAGDTRVTECLSIYHITRTYVCLARRSYRFHPVDGFEWGKVDIHSFPVSKITDGHPLWAYKWGEGPWKD
jgi:hypothetical protein